MMRRLEAVERLEKARSKLRETGSFEIMKAGEMRGGTVL